ncbi:MULTISPECIES: DNA/RNA helicase domain-containing protein [unclassified Flavobacterium]|uniref:DNA/RNA helicase domain-containing protein n=1 Tax=unclassified Flavobacterium TaxID=196869 RepID=UPI0025C2924D|nr:MULTISPECIES: DNA/RNA helicase domain-containing protein [unclassified Flavobacterium]
MMESFELSIEISEQYDFNKDSLHKIEQNLWVKSQWPLVYFIQNESKRVAYVGESTNAYSRIKNHLANPKKANEFTKISIIGSDKFNKSATLDIESNLIQYITSEGTYELKNGNYGLINHNYYQQDLYKDLFKEIWNKLIEKKVVSKSLEEIENSELFKYSPYKSLNEDQYKSVLDILDGLCEKESNRIFIKGSAGTGKTILATYLIKLLNSDISDSDLDDANDEELREINYIKAFQKKYPNAKIGLVIAMTSLRESLQNVFKKIPGLKASMVLNPSETFKLKEQYDLLIIDEAHRLRQYKNIGWMGVFRKNNQKLGLDDSGNELDWIIANSKNQIFFYDSAQSVKPSDINENQFTELLNQNNTLKIELTSQMRVKGGNDYIRFVDQLLCVNRLDKNIYSPNDYELIVFDSLKDLYSELAKKEDINGLCRLVAGYSWPWLSEKDKKAMDIEIDGLQFQWNQTSKDWVNSPNAFKEVGCIHTTQGYDLNYTGVIFGKEITFNELTQEIEIDSKMYFDKNGKRGVLNKEDLKSYIINIYKTIMYRGIRGTFVYACDINLRNYLKKHITVYKKNFPFRVLPFEEVKPYVNSVPLVNISVAAGSFSDLQVHSDFEWIELPFNTTVKEGYFVCKVVGDSMNKVIPNGSYCLFQKDNGGSREGKIVLVESTDIQDVDFGSGYTVKEYHSKKNITTENWLHKSITLKPLSFELEYENIELDSDNLVDFRVKGIFISVLV